MEAVAMSGIFIDAGPIGILKNKTGESITLKDINRGTIFDGPLVVLVNSMSASASEFLAAALQDYQRAIIVGSQTYGKATAQSLFSLDPDNPSFPPASSKISKETGYASVTLQKIYRINGKTAQLKGVTPHILLPDLFDSLHYSEKYQKVPLSSDSVLKKTYYQPLKLLPVKELQHKSSQRVGAHAGFAKVRQMSSVLAKQADHKEPISLRWSDFKKHTEFQYNTFHTEIQEPSVNSFHVSHGTFEKQRMQMDPYLEEFNKAWIKKLQTDISLEEGFNIICDYIDITLRKK
jgi:carboxyl-terminal processing protease